MVILFACKNSLESLDVLQQFQKMSGYWENSSAAAVRIQWQVQPKRENKFASAETNMPCCPSPFFFSCSAPHRNVSFTAEHKIDQNAHESVGEKQKYKNTEHYILSTTSKQYYYIQTVANHSNPSGKEALLLCLQTEGRSWKIKMRVRAARSSTLNAFQLSSQKKIVWVKNCIKKIEAAYHALWK